MDLTSISGVGPSTGLMIFRHYLPLSYNVLFANEDVKTIQGVKGNGTKTAQRIVLKLKDKMRKEGVLEKSLTLFPPIAILCKMKRYQHSQL